MCEFNDHTIYLVKVANNNSTFLQFDLANFHHKLPFPIHLYIGIYFSFAENNLVFVLIIGWLKTVAMLL